MGFPQKYYLCGMSEFSNQLEKKKDRKEKDKVRREKLAGYFFDLSKVTYTVLVVGVLVSILQEKDYMNIPLDVVVLVGIISAVVYARIGNNLLK